MEPREYLAIRRAFNLVRQQSEAKQRLTFFEFAILCRLRTHGAPLTTSQIAEYQGSLRPTMTHRTKHLADAGLLDRAQGNKDRRNVVCSISEQGSAYVEAVCGHICDVLHAGSVLSRTTARRICRYIDSMGTLPYMSGDLLLLALGQASQPWCTVSELVAALGLLQPTVSMSAAALEREGLVQRADETVRTARSAPLELTEDGRARADQLVGEIRALVVRRS